MDNGRVRPFPKFSVHSTMGVYQVAGVHYGFPKTSCQTLCTHAILNGKGTGLKQLANSRMTVLRCVWRYSSCLLGKFHVGVARPIRGDHGWITGQHTGNSEFLLTP